MTSVALILVAALACGTYWYVYERQPEASVAQPNGIAFIALPVSDANHPAVLVVAIENCSQEDAQRADRLTEDLRRNGIPVQRRHRIDFTLDDPAQSQLIQSVMSDRLPIVFVRGRAKANPTLTEVLAEYKGRAP